MRILGSSLVFGVSIALSMWCVWFVTHLPGIDVAPMTTGMLVLATMVIAGVVAGRYAPSRGDAWRVGGLAGLIAGCINLLVLGSYLVQPPDGQQSANEPQTHASNERSLRLRGGLVVENEPHAQAWDAPSDNNNASTTATPPHSPLPTAPQSTGEVLPAPPTGLRPAAGLAMLGFVVLSAAVIAGSVMLGRFTRGQPRLDGPDENVDWLARFAVVTAVTIAPLLLLGGLVTSTGSGLAVPDWPRTYGANMFLYPIGLMTRPRILLEHAHRLFGSLAGLTTMVLMIYALVSKRPAWAKISSIGLFVLVVAQGVIGGIRVNNSSTHLAMIHGVTAQLFFGLTVAYAVAINPFFRAAERSGTLRFNEDRETNTEHRSLKADFGGTMESQLSILTGIDPAAARRMKVFATGAMHSLIVQLLLGATYRHLRESHALWTHMAFSLVVVMFATSAGYAALKVSDQAGHVRLKRTLKLIGTSMIASVCVQFLLGWATWWVVQSSDRPLPTGDQVLVTPQVSTLAALLPTLHQANGAYLLACTTLAYVWSMRLKKATAL